jgi:hypothetical protein
MEEALVRTTAVEREYKRNFDLHGINKVFVVRYTARRIMADKDNSEIQVAGRLYLILTYLFVHKPFFFIEWIHSLETILSCILDNAIFYCGRNILSKHESSDKGVLYSTFEDDLLRAAALLGIEDFHDKIIAKARTEYLSPSFLGSTQCSEYFFLPLAVR